jgi:hypothetical protein
MEIKSKKESVIILNKSEIELLCFSKAKDDDLRDVITGIHFNNGEIVSTDGRRLCIIKKDFKGEMTIRFKKKTMKAKDKLVLDMQNMKWYICSIVNEEDDYFKISDDYIMFEAIEIKDTQYPVYKSVIPEKDFVYRTNFNTDFIPKGYKMTMEFNDDPNAISCRLEKDGCKADYILMPIRPSDENLKIGLLK